MPPIIIYCDGACLPTNPGGTATWAYVAKRDKTVVARDWGVECEGAEATAHVAEYAAVYQALLWVAAIAYEEKEVFIYSDSQRVIDTLTGKISVKVPHLRLWFTRCQRVAEELGTIQYRWIPREENTDADQLTEYAYTEYQHTLKNQLVPPQHHKGVRP